MISRAPSTRVQTTAAAMAVFATLMAACGGAMVLPPAVIAGHGAKSAVVHRNATCEDIKSTGRMNTTYDCKNNTLIVCCDRFGNDSKKPVDRNCLYCNNMCSTGAADVDHSGYLAKTQCRCRLNAPCTRISYVLNLTTDSVSELLQNYGKNDKVPPARHGLFTKSAAHSSVHRRTTGGVARCMSLLLSVAVHIFHLGT